jgi:uncharacterized protein (TIGR03083 family)
VGPSYDKEWSIAQVLSHLGSQAEIFAALLDAGITGEDPPGQESFPPIWDAWNARSPEAQATDSIAANARFVRRLEGFDAMQRSSFRLLAFGMDLDLAMFLRLRISEHAVHSWDVSVALDPSATVHHDAVEILLDGLPQLAARVGKPRGESLTVGDDGRSRARLGPRDRRGASRAVVRAPRRRSVAAHRRKSCSASSTVVSTPRAPTRHDSTLRGSASTTFGPCFPASEPDSLR